MDTSIYVLELDNDDRYIGMTTNTIRRLRDHKRGIGSIHTMGRQILGMTILWKGPVINKYHAMLIENRFAHRWRQQHKTGKVFGGELSPRYKKMVISKAIKRRGK